MKNAGLGPIEKEVDISSFSSPRSAESTYRLSQIARVRLNGMGNYISLPQLVVCGNQSAPLVMGGITKISLPREDATIFVERAVREVVMEDFNGKFHIINTPIDEEKLLGSLQKRVVVNMACTEALDGLNAYYKVSKDFLGD